MPETSRTTRLRMVMERDGHDPQTTLEFIPVADGILCGVAEVVALVRTHLSTPYQLWAIEEGAPITRGEVALRVRGHYLQLVPHISALTGLLSVASGWATAARQFSTAAHPLPVILTPPRIVHPAALGTFEHAVVVGGCLAGDSPWSRGLIPRHLILLMGDTLRAAQAYTRVLAPELPRLVRVDTFHDASDEAVRVALAMGDALTAVVVLAEQAQSKAVADVMRQVRAQLNLGGFPRVKIFVEGDITPETVQQWRQDAIPVDGFFTGQALEHASPILFAAELKETDGRPVARRGLVPGTTPNLRLKKLDGK